MNNRTRIAAVLALVCSAAAMAQTAVAPPDCATVEVQDVRPQQGLLMVAAYSNAADFGKKPVTRLRLKAAEAVMRFQLCGLQGQTAALMLFQDLDSDGKMGQNLVGMPTEPWGRSGTPGAVGPRWDTASLPLDGKTIVVQMSK